MGSSDFNLTIINWYAISSTTWVMIMIIMIFNNLSISSSISLPITNINDIDYDPTYLDDYLFNYSSKSLPQEPETGILYNISLPSNFSDMKVSFVRLRSNKLWSNGVNFSYFKIPPNLIRIPYVRRLAFVYENLGDLSPHFHELPGYTFLTNVVGFAVYNATDFSNSKRIDIKLSSKPIEVEFTHELVVPSQRKKKDRNVKDKLKKCVVFDPVSGVVELSSMLRPNVCALQGPGHFALAMPRVNNNNDSSSAPSSPAPFPSRHRKKRMKKKRIAPWVRWVVAIAVGLIGLMLLVLCFVVCYNIIVSRKIRRMEKNAIESETLGTTWIGNSKLPLAPVSRTQGVIENNFVP